MYVCMSMTLRNANFQCAAVRWMYGACTWPHYCCHISTASMMNWSVSLLRQQWITGPTEDEDDRVYRPSRNDTLSIIESLSISTSALCLSSTLRPLSDWVRMREASLHLHNSSIYMYKIINVCPSVHHGSSLVISGLTRAGYSHSWHYQWHYILASCAHAAWSH